MSNKIYDESDYNLDGNSLIQLDDGRILSYHYRKSYNYSLKIYDQKEFKEMLSIDLEKIIEQNNKNERPLTSRESNDLSVIQLKNKSILVGLSNYLIEIKLNKIIFESKIVFNGNIIILF